MLSGFGGPTQRGYAYIRVNLVRKETPPNYRFKEMTDTTHSTEPEQIGGFPGGSAAKSPPAAQQTREARFDPRLGKVPWRKKWRPAPAFLLGQSHGQRSLGSHDRAQTGKIILFC